MEVDKVDTTVAELEDLVPEIEVAEADVGPQEGVEEDGTSNDDDADMAPEERTRKRQRRTPDENLARKAERMKYKDFRNDMEDQEAELNDLNDEIDETEGKRPKVEPPPPQRVERPKQGRRLFVSRTEEDVGITQYLNKENVGFSAILKHRYTDFQVHEIKLDGKVVHLTDTTSTELPVDLDLAPQGNKFLTDDIIEQIDLMVQTNKGNLTVTVPAPEDKDDRKALHQAVKLKYPTVVANTTVQDGERCVQLRHCIGKKPDKEERWPKEIGCFLHFTLYKENEDTGNAIARMARHLRLPPKGFEYAGNKDKRGVTTQRVSAYKMKPNKLVAFNRMCDHIKIGDFRVEERRIALGDLQGNEFQVFLRDVKDKATALTACEGLQNQGFINYFGLQRFGAGSISTYEIGLKMLKTNYMDAVNGILEGGSRDESRCRWLRSWKANGDARDALAQPDCVGIERVLLESLAENGKRDPLGTLRRIPRQMQLMYLHSYQSYVWNRVVSARLAAHGTELLVGDLVAGEAKGSAEFVTEENKDSYTIFDMVLPLCGHSSKLPENDTKDLYMDILKAEDITDLAFFKHAQREYSLPGDYRKVFVRPTEFSYEVREYASPNDDVIETDLQRVAGEVINPPVDCEGPPVGNETPVVAASTENGSGPHTGLLLHFKLSSSCYATMLVRELTRKDTSAAAQVDDIETAPISSGVPSSVRS